MKRKRLFFKTTGQMLRLATNLISKRAYATPNPKNHTATFFLQDIQPFPEGQ
jgi:hypothetical protein